MIPPSGLRSTIWNVVRRPLTKHTTSMSVGWLDVQQRTRDITRPTFAAIYADVSGEIYDGKPPW